MIPTKDTKSQRDLSLAYSPGVAEPCREIVDNVENVYNYTAKSNLVAVISNGTAVLGLGDIGPEASKPVMEGKGVLFKTFADIDVFDLEINVTDVDKFVEIVKSLEPTFGGINLEDIKAPDCFEIEDRLKKELSIPVMHDDQHGTAIISAAGLLNAILVVKKEISDLQVAVSGAGAGAISCVKLLIELGLKRENVIMCDSKGVIRNDRQDISSLKRKFATNRDVYTIEDAMKGADVFLGLSKGDILTGKMLLSMNDNPIVFALANPDPEVDYNYAKSIREDIVIATGRSDYPNQINNVLGFPFIFRGALDVRAREINEAMKIAAVHSIASLARQPVTPTVLNAYNLSSLKFGRDYIVPKPLDSRLLTTVAPAVAIAAMESGVAQKPIHDIEEYKQVISKRFTKNDQIIKVLTNKARLNPKKNSIRRS